MRVGRAAMINGGFALTQFAPGLLLAASMGLGCSGDNQQLTCGQGTIAVGGECRPEAAISDAAGRSDDQIEQGADRGSSNDGATVADAASAPSTADSGDSALDGDSPRSIYIARCIAGRPLPRFTPCEHCLIQIRTTVGSPCNMYSKSCAIDGSSMGLNFTVGCTTPEEPARQCECEANGAEAMAADPPTCLLEYSQSYSCSLEHCMAECGSD
jgi:hypothetical protein